MWFRYFFRILKFMFVWYTRRVRVAPCCAVVSRSLVISYLVRFILVVGGLSVSFRGYGGVICIYHYLY